MTRGKMIREIVEKRFSFYTPNFQTLTHQSFSEGNREKNADEHMIDVVWAQFAEVIRSYHNENLEASAMPSLDTESGDLTVDGRKQLLHYVDEAQSQFEELSGLSSHDVENIYMRELHAPILERAAANIRKAEIADDNAPFSLRKARAAYQHWVKQPIWTAEEATALSFGRDPSKANIASLQNYKHLHGSRFIDDFTRLFDFINRSIVATQLVAPITPHVFVHWAKSHDIPLDDELVALVEEREDSNDGAELRLVHLEKENHELKVYIDRIHDIDFSDAKTKLSLYRILLGMATSSPFNFRHRKRNSASRIISGKCEEIGLKIGEETVKNWLDEAFEILGSDVIINDM